MKRAVRRYQWKHSRNPCTLNYALPLWSSCFLNKKKSSTCLIFMFVNNSTELPVPWWHQHHHCCGTHSCTVWRQLWLPAENTSPQFRISFLLAAVSFPSSCRGKQSPTVQTVIIKIPDYEHWLIRRSANPLQKKAKHIQIKKINIRSSECYNQPF